MEPNTAQDPHTSHPAPPSQTNAEMQQNSKASSVTGVQSEKEFNVINEKNDDGNLRRTTTAATLASIRDQLPHSFKLLAIVVALSLSIFLVSLDMTIVSTAIPKITDEFHSLQDIGWYGSGFFLTLAAFQSTWGKAYRYFPLKSTFLLSIFIFEVGSLICGVAQNSVTLIVGRAVAGVGGAGVASGAYTIIGFSAPPSRRAAYTGILGAVYGVSSVVGPLLGGVFTDHATWRWAFYVNLPIGGFAASVIFLTFQTPPAAKPEQASWKEKLLQMDLPGTFTIMAAVICFLLAIQWGGVSKSWNDSQVIGLLVGFGLLVIVFIAIQYFSGDRAVIQGRLLKNRNVLVGIIYIVFFSGSFFLLLYYLPIYFQSVNGISAADSGIRNLPLVLGTAIFSVISGSLISATGYHVPFLILGSVLSTIACGLIFTLDIGSSAKEWIGYQALAGIGIGLALQIPIIVGQASVEMSDLSTVTAMILFFQTIGGALFVQAGQAAFGNQLLQRLPLTAPNVDPALVLATGASSLREVFDSADLPGILVAYMDGLRVTYALAIALAGVGTIVALFSEWKSIKGKALTGGAV